MTVNNVKLIKLLLCIFCPVDYPYMLLLFPILILYWQLEFIMPTFINKRRYNKIQESRILNKKSRWIISQYRWIFGIRLNTPPGSEYFRRVNNLKQLIEQIVEFSVFLLLNKMNKPDLIILFYQQKLIPHILLMKLRLCNKVFSTVIIALTFPYHKWLGWLLLTEQIHQRVYIWFLNPMRFVIYYRNSANPWYYIWVGWWLIYG